MENGEVPWNEDDYAFDRRRLMVQRRERKDDPDYEQPQMHLHVAPQARQEVQAGQVSAPGPQNPSLKPDVCCLVKGCQADLTTSKAYYRRFRICEAHMKSLSLSIEGRSCRFCQQCGKFHLVEEFDGANRNCRKALMIRFYKRRNMPLTNLQAPGRGPQDAQAAAAAAAQAVAAPAAAQQELKIEPRKRGRPRAPRPDILEEDPTGSGGSGPGSPPPGAVVVAGNGTDNGAAVFGTSAAARAAAAAGFNPTLQAMYIAASRGCQGSAGWGVTPATAIGPPGYSQGGVRMAGIQVDAMDDDLDQQRPPTRQRRGASNTVSGGPGRQSGEDRIAGLDNDIGVGLTLEDMQAAIQAQVQAQLVAQQQQQQHEAEEGRGGGAGGGGDNGMAEDGGPLVGEQQGLRYSQPQALDGQHHGSGSLSRCSSSLSQDQDPDRGRGAKGRNSAGGAGGVTGGGALGMATTGGHGGGSGPDAARDAMDALAALSGVSGPMLDVSGLLASGTTQLDLANLLGSLGQGGLLQVLPVQAGNEGARLQLLRSPLQLQQQPQQQTYRREESGWRDAPGGVLEPPHPPGSRPPSHTSGRAIEEVHVGGQRRALVLDYNGRVPTSHVFLGSQDADVEEEQGGYAGGGVVRGMQVRGFMYGKLAGGSGRGAAEPPPLPSMAAIKREGIEVQAGPIMATGNSASLLLHDPVTLPQESPMDSHGERTYRLSLRDPVHGNGVGGLDASGGGGLRAPAGANAVLRLGGQGQHGPAVQLSTADIRGHAGGATGLTLPLDVSALSSHNRARVGGAVGTSAARPNQVLLTTTAGGGGNGTGGGAVQILRITTPGQADLDRVTGTVGNGNGVPGNTSVATAVADVRLRSGPGAKGGHVPVSSTAVLSLAPGGGNDGGGGEEDLQGGPGAAARLLSQMPASRQLDLLQQLPHEQMVALLQLLPQSQQMELLMELQDERRMRAGQEQQEQQSPQLLHPPPPQQHQQQEHHHQQAQQQSQHQHQPQQVQLQLHLQPQRQQTQPLVLLQGRGSSATGGTLALDLGMEPSVPAQPAQPVARPSSDPASTAAIQLGQVTLQRKPPPPRASLTLQAQPQLQTLRQGGQVAVATHQEPEQQLLSLGGGIGSLGLDLDLVSLAGAGTRLQRLPDGSTQVVLELPVATTTAASNSSPVPVLRLQTATGGGPTVNAGLQLTADNGPTLSLQTGGGGGGGSVTLNLSNGSIQLPANALVVRGGGGGGRGATQTATASLPLLASGGEYSSSDVLERLSLKLHGVRPEQLAPDVAHRLQVWMQSMDAVTMQGTLRSGCVHLVLDINRLRRSHQTPSSQRLPLYLGHANGQDPKSEGLESAGDRQDVPAPGFGHPLVCEAAARDRLAAAAMAAALGLELGPDSGADSVAVGAALAARGVRALVQVGNQVVYPPSDGTHCHTEDLPTMTQLAPLAVTRGAAAVLQLSGSCLSHPAARLHVRLNGRRLGAQVAGLSAPGQRPTCTAAGASGCDGGVIGGGHIDSSSDRGTYPAARLRRTDSSVGVMLSQAPGDGARGEGAAVEHGSSAPAAVRPRTNEGRPHPRGVRPAGKVVVSEPPEACEMREVLLQPPGEVGLAVLEWESGDGSGRLGNWRPLLVAPTEQVAAEVNALGAAVVAEAWQEETRKRCGVDGGVDTAEACGDLERAAWLQTLLTDLGLVLDAMYNSNSNSEQHGADDIAGDSGVHGSIGSMPHAAAATDPKAGSAGARSMGLSVRNVVDLTAICAAGCRRCQHRRTPRSRGLRREGPGSGMGSRDVADGSEGGYEADVEDSACVRQLSGPSDSALAPVAAVASGALGGVGRGWRHTSGVGSGDEVRHLSRGAAVSRGGLRTGQVTERPERDVRREEGLEGWGDGGRRHRGATAAADAAIMMTTEEAAAAAGLEPAVLSSLIRRAMRLLPFLVARGMSFTAFEILQFLTRIARVPLSRVAALRLPLPPLGRVRALTSSVTQDAAATTAASESSGVTDICFGMSSDINNQVVEGFDEALGKTDNSSAAITVPISSSSWFLPSCSSSCGAREGGSELSSWSDDTTSGWGHSERRGSISGSASIQGDDVSDGGGNASRRKTQSEDRHYKTSSAFISVAAHRDAAQEPLCPQPCGMAVSTRRAEAGAC